MDTKKSKQQQQQKAIHGNYNRKYNQIKCLEEKRNTSICPVRSGRFRGNGRTMTKP